MNTTYIVQKGDTLYGISRQYNTSAQKIRELNNLTSDNIYPNQILIITDNSDSNPTECVTYTVVKGDSLYNIAKKYNTTVDDIKRYNNLTNNNLSINQKLKIPCHIEEDKSLPNYTSYIIKAGDSLYSIAKKYNTTVDKIKKNNNLNSDTLTIGNTLLIEDTTTDTDDTILECYGEDYELEENYSIYIVKSGDNLYNIAKQFNTSVNELKALNNLTNNNLSIGQELKIPTTNGNISYTVVKGDSLYSIAKKFNTTVDSIKNKNNLTTNLLSIGQKLII